ncbi:MAG: DUF4350 domain-containing protein [Lachnospiraceae bacterium]|nr:DUF4350 domain-containing protein [Lachnospiraceae bacterium]
MIQIPETSDIRQTREYRGRALLVKAAGGASYDDALAETLKTHGVDLVRGDWSMPPEEIFSAGTADLVIIEDASRTPAGTAEALTSFLHAGGRLLTLGGPAFTETVCRTDGEWISRSGYLKKYVSALSGDSRFRILDTSDQTAVSSLRRTSNSPDNALTETVGDFGLAECKAELCVDVASLVRWEMLRCDFTNPKKGLNAIGFFAKGDRKTQTNSLYIEVSDSDTRWFALVDVTGDWAYYMLSETDFRYWSGNAEKKTQTLDMDDVKSFSIGFSFDARPIPPGHHVYSFAEPELFRADASVLPDVFPVIDCLTPAYEWYPVTNAASLTVCDSDTQPFLSEKELKVPSELVSCIPGRQGKGFESGRAARFIPLIGITDEKGLHSGYAAWINVFSGETENNGEIEGSVIGSFGAVSDDFYDAAGLSAVAETAKALLNPVFLVEGGMTENIYVASDVRTVRFGGSCVDITKSGVDAAVTAALFGEDGRELAKVSASGRDLKAAVNRIQTVSGVCEIDGACPVRAVTELTAEGKVIDRIVHNVKYWAPKPVSERKYVTVEDGCFRRGGKIVNFFGVNYMPSYGSGEPVPKNFEKYVSDPAYDRDVIHNDLLHVRDIGFNAVSVFVYVDTIRETNNILDLITQCEELGIFVDLSIRPHAYPMSHFSGEEVEELIKKLHFDEIDNIIAYDIAWEPKLGVNVEGSLRAGWDEDWRRWIDMQYGSAAHAEELWGVKAPRDAAGNLVSVPDTLLEGEAAPTAPMVAAYRRFVDDQVAKIFNEKLSYMRSFDPNHLFSFRMSVAGSPAIEPSKYTYDFQSLASTIDFMAPEGYMVNLCGAGQVLFANAYARYTNPGKPVVWKEYGAHVWSGSNFGDHHVSLARQADFYSVFLDAAFKSCTSALYCWFYAAGYRLREKTDFGVLNPDGSDRPGTAYLREYAPKFISQGKRRAAEVLIEVERDDHPSSLKGMNAAVGSRLAAAYENGQIAAFVNRRQSSENGTFFASSVLDQAVGGTGAEGQFPFRYINGQILSVSCSDGVATVVFVNTGHAAWDAGLVSLVSSDGAPLAVISSVIPYLGVSSVSFFASSVPSGLRFAIGDVLFGYRY